MAKPEKFSRKREVAIRDELRMKIGDEALLELHDQQLIGEPERDLWADENPKERRTRQVLANHIGRLRSRERTR
jgi:hypothetical protein